MRCTHLPLLYARMPRPGLHPPDPAVCPYAPPWSAGTAETPSSPPCPPCLPLPPPQHRRGGWWTGSQRCSTQPPRWRGRGSRPGWLTRRMRPPGPLLQPGRPGHSTAHRGWRQGIGGSSWIREGEGGGHDLYPTLAPYRHHRSWRQGLLDQGGGGGHDLHPTLAPYRPS